MSAAETYTAAVPSDDQEYIPATALLDTDPTEPPAGPRLTPELSQENPDLYKSRLLDTLRDSSVSGIEAVRAAGADMDALTFYANRYTSRAYDNGRVDLGVGPMDQPVRDQILFQAEAFGPDEEVAYRFLHEASHTLYEEVLQTPEGKALETLNRQHRTPLAEGQGLTALASLDHYSGNVFRRHKEDGTELLTMYYYGGPDYLAAYASYLSDPKYEQERQAKGLATLTAEAAGVFVETVTAAANAALAHSAALRAPAAATETL